MTFEEHLRQKLTSAFQPQLLEIINESDQHIGHPGSPHTSHSHFAIKMIADAFKHKTRIENHRLVYAVLEEELKGKIHALRLDLK